MPLCLRDVPVPPSPVKRRLLSLNDAACPLPLPAFPTETGRLSVEDKTSETEGCRLDKFQQGSSRPLETLSSSCLYSGSIFKGHQKSGRNCYQVSVELQVCSAVLL